MARDRRARHVMTITLRRSVALLPQASRRLPLVRAGASSDSFLVHSAKLLGYGVALPIGIGALLFGKFGAVYGIAVAASVIGNEIYVSAVRS